MQDRPDLFASTHKGIRAMLLHLVQKAGTTDFTDAAVLASLTADAKDIFELLELHSKLEDEYILPLLRGDASGVAATFGEAHGDLDARLHGLLAALVQIDATAPDAAKQGHRFIVQLSRIAGELLVHMSDEELELNPALWSNTTNEALIGAQQAITRSLAPDQSIRFLRWMYPALNPRERAAFAALLPPPAREFVATL